MKLCLVSVNKNRTDGYPMGILSLATYLNKYTDFDLNVDLIDANFDNDLLQKIINSKPDMVGISSMTIDYQLAIDLAKKLKKELNVPIILGGVHISTLPTSLNKVFDFGVRGEGEKTLLELLQLYQNKRKFLIEDLKKIKGLVFHDGSKRVLTAPRELLDIDELPIWDRDLINQGYFAPKTIHNNKVGISDTIFTSRGCPYNCRFCSTRNFWEKVRFHSEDRVIKEIIYLHDSYGVTNFNIGDDLFTVNKKRVRSIIEKLKEVKLLGKLTFACNTRANVVDEELCQLLKKMNVTYVGFGFESGSDKMLKWLKNDPNLSVDKNKMAAKLCKKYGFSVNGSLIFGSPGETLDDMRETLDLIDYFVKLKINNVWSFVMTPFPATEVWEIAKTKGEVDDYDMDWNKLSCHSFENPMMLDDSIDKEEFKKIFLEGRRKLKYFKWQKVRNDLLSGKMFRMIKNTIDNPRLLSDLIFKRHTLSETRL